MKSKEVEFFNLEYKDIKLVINAGKYIFYKNIYVFVNRLKDLITNKNDIKNVLTAYLYRSILI